MGPKSPIDITFDRMIPLQTLSSTTNSLDADSDTSRDSLSNTLTDDETPIPDPPYHISLDALLSTNATLLREYYPLAHTLPVTVTHFGRNSCTRSEDNLVQLRTRWGSRRHQLFLQSKKLERDGAFTWVNGSTRDLVWMVRIASASRNWVESDLDTFLKSDEVAAVLPVMPDDVVVEPPSAEELEALSVRMDGEYRWHVNLLSWIAKCMRMSQHGAYLEPTMRLPLPQKGDDGL